MTIDLNGTDTVAAISTPPGQGGIGIVRLSGPKALEIGLRILDRNLEPRRLSYCWAVDPASGQRIDEVMAVYLPAPRTYTREDMVEIHGHGGSACLNRLIRLCVDRGARVAGPGEFTRRAFLNGRIDLAQAEAVADLIRARTEGSRLVALTQLEGGLSSRVAALEDELLSALAHLEGALDFPEHDETGPGPGMTGQIRVLVDRVRSGLADLLAGADRGRILRDGMTVVISGRPNVGKSSLLNALLEQERALVSPSPGTTRDTIEEGLDLGGVPAVLVDTAGLREGAGEQVEQMGIDRARRWLERADFTLLVLDSAEGLTGDDRQLIAEIGGRPAAIVINKIDLKPRRLEATDLGLEPPVIEVSAREGWGLEDLRTVLRDRALLGSPEGAEAPLVSSLRHRQALERALVAVDGALDAAGDLPPEMVAVDLREALHCLGEISGRDVASSLLDTIFSTFCVGK